MFNPGNQNDTGNANKSTENAGTDGKTDPTAIDSPEKKGFFDKVKDALQEWSNNDQQEQEEDDATP